MLVSRKTIQRAMAFHRAGYAVEAERCYRAILKVKPNQFDALYYLGLLEAQQGRGEEALRLIGQALKINPRLVEAHAHHGNVLKTLGRHAEALASYDHALALLPGNAAALYNRGVILQELKRNEEALASYDKALAITPDDVEVLTNHGIVLYELKRHDEALASYERALAIKPGFAEALNNRGNVLRELNRPEEALASFDQALAINPGHIDALNNRGLVLQALNRDAEALASYDRALAIDPDYADSHWAAGLCSLALGDYARGWREYEWRWRTADFPSPRRNFPQPLWVGQADIRRKTILLYGEQGFGDTLQFCRYVEMVMQLGARVVLEVQPPLKNLLTQIPGVQQVLGAGEALPEFDFQCPLLSLPLAFGTRRETVPARPHYLGVSPESVQKWRARIGQRDVLTVGVAWAGSATHKNQRNRSLALSQLLPLTECGIRLVSLQKDLQPGDRELFARRRDFLHFEDDLADFSDTAAAMSQMDLVISVDTAIAHLAGAMGKPVWIMLPHVAEWRWMRNCEQTPWYPTARLFRQSTAGDWSGVIERIANALVDYGKSKQRQDVEQVALV
jgi:tetratricopeptide (TPR) repeat protein